jgi:hypothetical protein
VTYPRTRCPPRRRPPAPLRERVRLPKAGRAAVEPSPRRRMAQAADPCDPGGLPGPRRAPSLQERARQAAMEGRQARREEASTQSRAHLVSSSKGGHIEGVRSNTVLKKAPDLTGREAGLRQVHPKQAVATLTSIDQNRGPQTVCRIAH